ncbi:chorismate-binding protein [Micrococcus terreus]|uniref:chorismate-binding protein n=1 Tax=Micrococcus terreus TaxID=574650 RepID=UPI0030179071
MNRPLPMLLGIDGRSGAGKTSLALELAALLRPHLSISVFHLDSIYPGWDGLSHTVEELADLILEPLAQGRTAHWRWWDWTTDQPGRAASTEPADVVIIEGVGAGNWSARTLLDTVVWVELDQTERRRRALDRDGETFERHWEQWARQERAYLAQDPVAEEAELILRVGEQTPHAPPAAAQVLEALRLLPAWEPALRLVPGSPQRRHSWRTVHLEGSSTSVQELFAAAGGPDAELAVLLESSDHAVTPDPHRSGHSIFGLGSASAGPVMQHRDGVTTVRQGAVTVRREQGFFSWLASAWPTPRIPDDAASSPTGVPFQPGWLGWMGHEVKRETGSPDGAATGRAARDLPDALFFQPDRGGVLDHRTGTVCLFWSAEDRAGEAWAEKVLAVVGKQVEPGAEDGEMTAAPVFRLRDARETYLGKVRAAQEQIRQGNSYEVCLTTQLQAELFGDVRFDGWSVYRRLVAANPAPFTLYARVRLEGSGVTGAGADGLDAEVVSSSPERFLRIGADGTLVTEPIKGTRPRGADPETDAALARELAESVKDRAENIMITDLARNDLSRFAVPGTLATTRLCAIESYPTVHQMVSTVTARLQPGVPRADAVAAAFPPGSMTGAPKISTMDILEELESGPRGVYSGVAGYLSADGAADLNVLIRTLVVVHEVGREDRDENPDGERPATRLSLGVGGAITSDSVPEQEWDEVRTKARGVLGVLGSDFPE